MANKFFALTIVAVAALSMTACSNDRSSRSVADMPPGKYEKTSTFTDADGTTYERTSTTDVDVDRYGNKKVVIENKKSTDPRGLFNKSTSKSKQVIEEERD